MDNKKRILFSSLLFLFLTFSGASAQSWRTEVNHAIDRGIKNLLTMQQKDGSFRVAHPSSAHHNSKYSMGVTALAVYTLVKSGLPADDPAAVRALEFLRYKPFKKVYSVSTLILALDSISNPANDEWIRRAAKWLVDNVNEDENIWAYPEGTPDYSNTQFAVLGLWVAEKHGFKVPKRIWLQLLIKTVEFQNEDGGFGYRSNHLTYSAGTMTTAGITILTLSLWRLEKDVKFSGMKRKARVALQRAWRYMDRVFTATGNPAGSNGQIRDLNPTYFRNYTFHYYYLYGLERIAAFSERKEIGGRDWYYEGAIHLLGTEGNDGGWGTLENSCFALLFLRRATFSGLSGKTGSHNTPRAVFWRYTTSAPAKGWEKEDYDDSSWAKGAGAFGQYGTPGDGIRTVWEQPDIWVRRFFEWNGKSIKDFRLYAVHDDGAEIYINGILAAKLPTYNPKYVEVKVKPEALAALKKGKNFIAAHCHEIGGAQILNIRFFDYGKAVERRKEKDGSHERWWKGKPKSTVPFIKSWLVFGPLPDPKNKWMTESFFPEEKAAPREGKRNRGLTWRAVRTFGSLLDFGRGSRPKEECIYYAFTYLVAMENTEAVLWLGSDDGCRVYLDGKLVLSHFSIKSTPADGLPLHLRLTKGFHRLLIKVRNFKGASSVYARISRKNGTPNPFVLPFLSDTHPDWESLALAQPSLLSNDKLLRHLPLDVKTRLTFNSEQDLEKLAFGENRSGYPCLLNHSNAKGASYKPSPGAKGILALWPLSTDVPSRILRKIKIVPGRNSIVVKVSAEAVKAPGKARSLVRLGIYDGTLKWLAQESLLSRAKPSPEGWRILKGNVESYAGKEVLLIVECVAEKDSKVPCAFIDEIILR